MRADSASGRIGYSKVEQACKIALDLGYRYLWMDTCCIDKTSSAEVSQAINSMFQYYQKAEYCIAFLSDWDPTSRDGLRESRWFKRGWTLQELLAPKRVEFYDANWQCRGDKIELSEDIQAAAKIQRGVLNGSILLEDVPVAVRMSWASSRETKYIEDTAYCLLGIFDINMPLLYGEGNKAFLRLQEELIKQSRDMSIFAWRSKDNAQKYTGLLATSPELFVRMDTLVFSPDALAQSREYNITNRGIRFHLPLTQDEESGYFLLPVNHGYIEGENLAVFLRQVGMDLFVRARPCERLEPLASGDEGRQQLQLADRSFHVKILSLEQSKTIDTHVLPIQAPEELTLVCVEPTGSWSPSEKILYAGHTGVFVGYMHYSSSEWSDAFDTFVLVCHFAKNQWRYDLVRGDDWTEIKPQFYERYRNGVNLGDGDAKLVLPHLWEEHNAKVVETVLRDGRLRIHISHE
ncbi:hypothetical protein J4E90_009804 [Alternaria incomplexa]|uniref:uncharacterized protein n=1 Tax=Alternaria incomplexa TaxID=1187928 RepID=UPI0022209AC0|nr:uncharacterized protein J4E90_009804 [Alternaria incomplexa]KAI4907301.1 hypothetical protein J4E90_009804 [Alternaria incomplexa]